MSSMEETSGLTPGTGTCWSWLRRKRVHHLGQGLLITLDKGFGELIYVLHVPHAGLIRLPDVRMAERITLIEDAINLHGQDLEQRAIVTIQAGRTRVSRPDTI